MCGASSVIRDRRLTKLRSPSAAARSPADRYLPYSSIRFHRCPRAKVRISVSSGRGFAGAHASPPPGAMMWLAKTRNDVIWLAQSRVLRAMPRNSAG
jgi:hypothetical protein